MTITNPSERYKRNPLEWAQDFAAQEELRRQQVLGEEASPTMTPVGQPMSTAEQAVSDIEGVQTRLAGLQNNDQAYTDQFIQAADRKAQLENQANFEAQLAGQGSQNLGDYSGPIANADVGELSSSRQQVLKDTSSYAGTRYQLGGTTARGIDCSGLVMSVYNKAGFDISQHSAGWQGRNIPGVRTAVNNLQPGDIVAWKDGSHIAIYAGNGMIWDAASRTGTSMRQLWAPQSAVYGIKLRFPGE